MQKNAVLGVSVNFDPMQLKNLILSFREVNTVDDIILFVDPVNLPLARSYFSKYNVQFKSYLFHELIDTTVHNSRYLKFLEFLLEQTEYKNIFLSDTKDVIFQNNVFEHLEDDKLYFCQEDSNVRVFDDPSCNAWWINQAYGPEILNLIGPNNIICSGTIIGSYEKMLKLLVAVKNEILKIKQERRDVFNGLILDQAIINYLARVDSTISQDCKVTVNGEIVATLGVSMADNFNHSDMVLINGYNMKIGDRVPSIIHQYDRNEILKALFNQKYVL